MKEQGAQNSAFQQMQKAALQRLRGKAAVDIEARTGIPFDRQRRAFLLSSLGVDVQISYPNYDICPVLDEWHQLLILHYLDMADGTPLSDQLMAFGDQSSGMARGGGFDRQSERDLSLRMGNRTGEDVEKACRALGGTLIDSNADFSAVFFLFPRYPIILKLWFADEEIQGSGRLFLDRSAGRYLSTEDAVTAGSLLLEALFQKLDALCPNGAQ